ncbi:MAG: carboxypeptidase-like regulatory domain-containing protein [Cyclobacteriaceae bacterium]
MIKCLLWTLLFTHSIILSAQTISGNIYDDITKSPLYGATVVVSELGSGGASDENGRYKIDELPSGRYSLEVSYVGYEKRIISNVWIKSGVSTYLDIALQKSVTNLDEIIVFVESTLSKPGEQRITEEAINRYAAAYNDPARLITSSPDIVVVNDQNNLVSVRGVSPDYNVWRLEGAEVVNPNHLSNAGTFLDQPTASGGGVNILSAQMLSASDFRYGTFSSQYGNSVGGIFDMNLKSGNQAEHQFTAQASFIGFDLASEGPIKKDKPATYAINYRYSFTGLLANMGVDFGGETIGFQDLAFNVASPLGDRSRIKIFGVGGASFNEFNHSTFTESKIEKDRNDIDYENKTGAIGVNFQNTLKGSKGNLEATLILSGFDNQRKVIRYDTNDAIEDNLKSNRSKTILSSHLGYRGSTSLGSYRVGMNTNKYFTDDNPATFESNDYWLSSPYITLNRNFSSNWYGEVGVTALLTKNNSTLDPRLKISHYISRNHTIAASAGIYSQLLDSDNYIYSNHFQQFPAQRLTSKFIRSARSAITHSYSNNRFNFWTELYYYQFQRVFDSTNKASSANTYGVTLSAERSVYNGLYYKVGANLFKSLIDNQPTHQDIKYNLNASIGKEWIKRNNGIGKGLSINFKSYLQGGNFFATYRYTDESGESKELSPYRLDNFFRMDFRIVWTRYKSNRTSSLALDIQNLTNAENESFRYFDTFTQQIESQYNLGLIPILTYRVEW